MPTMSKPENEAAAHESDPFTKFLRELGGDIISVTAGRNDALMAGAASVSADYSSRERFTFIYKEEGSAKIGPEFVIQDQITTKDGDSLKTYAFRWPEHYVMDRATWGLTIIDNSLPPQERRRSIPGGVLKEDDLRIIDGLVGKARQVINGQA